MRTYWSILSEEEMMKSTAIRQQQNVSSSIHQTNKPNVPQLVIASNKWVLSVQNKNALKTFLNLQFGKFSFKCTDPKT